MPKADTIGAIYRQRREELRIPLDVAADATNIRARMLATLESGDFSAYPPHGHAVGMLSSYARYLGLDPHPILERYEVEYADFQASQEMASMAERTKRGVGRFGERVSATDRPVSRDSSHVRKQAGAGRRAADEAAGGARIAAKLSDERAAEGDERYKSGSVKVLGTRQADVRSRSGSRRSAGGASSTRAGSSASMPGAAHTAAPAGGGDRGAAPSRAQRPAATGSTGPLPTRTQATAAPAGEAAARTRPAGDKAAPRLSGSARQPRPVTPSRQASSTGRFKSAVATDEALSETQKEALGYFSGPLDEDGTAQQTGTRKRVARDAAQQGEDGRSSLSEKVVAARSHLIALVVVIVVIVAIIAAVVLVTTSGSNGTGVIDVTGGAQDTTTTTSDPNSATATVTTTNGNPVTVVVSVAEGGTSLISITYDDDNAYSGTAVGPWEREFLVTESFTATVGTPSAVSITQNGEEAAFEEDEDGNGVFTLQVSTVATADEDEDGDTGSEKSSKSKKSKKNS